MACSEIVSGLAVTFLVKQPCQIRLALNVVPNYDILLVAFELDDEWTSGILTKKNTICVTSALLNTTLV